MSVAIYNITIEKFLNLDQEYRFITMSTHIKVDGSVITFIPLKLSRREPFIITIVLLNSPIVCTNCNTAVNMIAPLNAFLDTPEFSLICSCIVYLWLASLVARYNSVLYTCMYMAKTALVFVFLL